MIILNSLVSFVLFITNVLLLITYKKMFNLSKMTKSIKDKKINNVM